jgi:hypothetical protein
MDHTAKKTNDHETIKKWAEERDGHPAMVESTMRDDSGLLRIDFEEPEENLTPVSWEKFFKTFDEKKLTFLYQEETAEGKQSRFFKFIEE